MPGSRVYLRQCATCAPEAVLSGDNLEEVGGSTTLQLKVRNILSFSLLLLRIIFGYREVDLNAD